LDLTPQGEAGEGVRLPTSSPQRDEQEQTRYVSRCREPETALVSVPAPALCQEGDEDLLVAIGEIFCSDFVRRPSGENELRMWIEGDPGGPESRALRQGHIPNVRRCLVGLSGGGGRAARGAALQLNGRGRTAADYCMIHGTRRQTSGERRACGSVSASVRTLKRGSQRRPTTCRRSKVSVTLEAAPVPRVAAP
jgi:hypothetical protein